MLGYIVALFLGLVAGFFLPSGFFSKGKTILFNLALVALLFFMGVSLGKDSEILSKIADFGYISGVMSLSVVIFSVIFAVIITKLFRSRVK